MEAHRITSQNLINLHILRTVQDTIHPIIIASYGGVLKSEEVKAVAEAVMGIMVPTTKKTWKHATF